MPYEIVRFPFAGTIDATNYPHPDHASAWAPALERFVSSLSASTRAKVLGENVARIHGI